MASNKPSGGRAPRRKGSRLELAVVRLLQDRGIAGERVPLSGSCGGSYAGDVSTPLLGVDRLVECKARGGGFKELYRWLIDRDLLVLKADRQGALVVLRLSLAIEIAAAAEAKGRAS